MLTQLRFKNFKAWKDSGPIRLAPLTVLFGKNSAGKTSLAQLLLMLKQTVESSDRQRALQLGDSRSLVDLGTYEDVVYNHDTDKPLAIDLSWNTYGQRGFSVTFRGNKNKQPHVSRFEYRFEPYQHNASPGASKVTKKIGMSRNSNGKYELIPKGIYIPRKPENSPTLPSPSHFHGFPSEVSAYYQNTVFTSDLVLDLEKLLHSIYYVGPLREYPKRLYLWAGEVPDHVGIKGEQVIPALLAGRGRHYSLARTARRESLMSLVGSQLRRLGLIKQLTVRSVREPRTEYEILVKSGFSLPEVKLTDIGFGVSQVLPVIVECFYVPQSSIVLFEQPELHLHPKAQSELADLFIDAIHAREEGNLRDCQFIIESHSEHFLRRLQRRIAEEKLSSDQAALYFVHSKGGAAHLEELDVDTYGNIRNWPEGFFGDEMEDLVARSEAQAQRTARERNEK